MRKNPNIPPSDPDANPVTDSQVAALEKDGITGRVLEALDRISFAVRNRLGATDLPEPPLRRRPVQIIARYPDGCTIAVTVTAPRQRRAKHKE